MKSRQFQSSRIIGKDAHVNVIYLLPRCSSLYILWRGLLFIIWRWAVESLITVIFNSSHAFKFINKLLSGNWVVQHDRIMKKILLALALSTAALAVNAQFTTYQSINPKVPQQSGTQSNNDAPFTSYQSINARIRQNSDIRSGNGSNMQLPQRLIRGVYLNTINNEAQYIKIKVVDSGMKQYAKAYYDASLNQWYQCNSEVLALGIYDSPELREYFSCKVSIPNIGVIYY